MTERLKQPLSVLFDQVRRQERKPKRIHCLCYSVFAGKPGLKCRKFFLGRVRRHGFANCIKIKKPKDRFPVNGCIANVFELHIGQKQPFLLQTGQQRLPEEPSKVTISELLGIQ